MAKRVYADFCGKRRRFSLNDSLENHASVMYYIDEVKLKDIFREALLTMPEKRLI